jgi:4-amino-4-deoxy-L-arabinose transferase-like glycosyltransferase
MTTVTAPSARFGSSSITASYAATGSSYSRWIYAALTAYVLGFAIFPPRTLLVIDESSYVAQAVAFAHGALTLQNAAPLYPPDSLRAASNYPPGTALLQAPFVAVGSWRAAAVASVLALIIATLVTMRWLRDQDKNPAYAMLVPAFGGALFFGRIAMSDVPSAAWIALALWTLFRAERDWRWSIAAGLLGATSLLFREPNGVLLAPFFLGAIVRKKCDVRALIFGAALGIAVRLTLSKILFGSALYVRDSGFGFSFASGAHNLVQYGAILLLMFPLGALLPFVYRGPRRVEMLVSFCAYMALFLFYNYTGVFENGRVKGLILVSRFVVPMLPLLAFMAADVWPRWFAALSSRRQRLVRGALPVVMIFIVLVAFAIHAAVRRQERGLLPIVQAIDAGAPVGVPVITNHQATLKYLSPVYGARPMILRAYINPADVPVFYARYKRLNLVFLDRSDSEMFRRDAADNAIFLAGLSGRCELKTVHDSMNAGMRLRILRILSCAT